MTLHTGQRNQPHNETQQEPTANQEEDFPDESLVFLSLPYIGDRGEAIIKKTTKMLSKFKGSKAKFRDMLPEVRRDDP